MTWALEAAQHHTVSVQPVVPVRTLEGFQGRRASMMYNDKQLTAAIKNAATMERLAQLVHTCSLNPIHIATVFVKLTSLSKTSAQGVSAPVLVSRDRMQTLQVQEQLTAHLQQILLASQCAGHCCRGLANIVWALGKLEPNAEVLSMLLEKFFNQLSESVPQDIANVLWGVAQITRDRGLSPGFFQTAASGATQSGQDPPAASAMPQSVNALGRQDSSSSSSQPLPFTSTTDASLQTPGSGSGAPAGADTEQSEPAAVQHALLSVQQVQQLLQRLVDTLQQAAPQTISNITCALCVLQHCHQWCMCSCLPQIKEIITAFANHLADALPSHVQKVVRCLTQLSVACSAHARQEWVEWQPPLLQSMLAHLVLQRRTVKQFHIASVLRDITQLSCLFLEPEQAAEVAGTAVAGAPDSQQQEQQVLWAVAAAAAAVDEALDLHSRGYSADDLGDDVFGTVGILSSSTSFTADIGRVQDNAVSGFSAPAAIAGTGQGGQQPRTPVSALVHNIVSGMFRRLVLEDTLRASAADSSSSKESWCAGVALGGLLPEADQQRQQLQSGEGSDIPDVSAMVVSLPNLTAHSTEAEDISPAGGTHAAAEAAAASKPSASRVLDKLTPQLQRLGVLQQYNALKALCAQQGAFGAGTGASTAPAFMQPYDRPLYSRSHGSLEYNHRQQHVYGGGSVPGQQHRGWERSSTQQRVAIHAGHSFAAYQRGLASNHAAPGGHIPYGRASPVSNMGESRDSALYTMGSGGHLSGAVGRVYIQQQMMISNSNYLLAQQYPPHDVAKRQQQQPFSMHDVAVTADFSTVTEQLGDTAMVSPFERTASLVGRSGSSSSSAGPPCILSPRGSSAGASGFHALSGSSASSTSAGTGVGAVRFGFSAGSTSLQSGQTHSGGVSAAVGNSGSFLPQGSVLHGLGSAAYAGAASSGATGASPFEASLSTCAVGQGDVRLKGLGVPAACEAPLTTTLVSMGSGQQHFSFVSGTQQRVQQLCMPGEHSTAGLLSQPPGLVTGSTAVAVQQQQQQEQQRDSPVVIVQHGGQDTAYRQMPDGTLVPLQQRPLLTAGPSFDVSVSAEVPNVALNAGLQLQQPGLAALSTGAVGLAISAAPHQHGGDLQYFMPARAEGRTSRAVYAPTAALDHAAAGMQQASYRSSGVAANLLDATGVLAANQLLLQQQQQQQMQQATAQQQFVQLPNGQLVQVVSPGYNQAGSTDLDASQAQLTAAGLSAAATGAGQHGAAVGINGHTQLVLSPETAQLLVAMQGQQQQQQAAQQQQQVYYMMPQEASF